MPMQTTAVRLEYPQIITAGQFEAAEQILKKQDGHLLGNAETVPQRYALRMLRCKALLAPQKQSMVLP